MNNEGFTKLSVCLTQEFKDVLNIKRHQFFLSILVQMYQFSKHLAC